MLTPMLPTVVSSWLDVPWVVDHSLYTLETVDHEKCLVHSAPEWHTYTVHVSRLKNPSLTCLLPFSYTDVKWI